MIYMELCHKIGFIASILTDEETGAEKSRNLFEVNYYQLTKWGQGGSRTLHFLSPCHFLVADNTSAMKQFTLLGFVWTSYFFFSFFI